jgi:restriction endonuclease S subunit
VGSNSILGAEIGVRYTFTDNLDGSNPINSNFAVYQFADINNNDWYVFSGISFTYTFTRKPCRDCFD